MATFDDPQAAEDAYYDAFVEHDLDKMITVWADSDETVCLLPMLLAIKGFSAAMLGGMGSFVGAVIGGFVFSFLESFAATFISGSLKELVTFIVIINVLLFMPRGIMGPRMSEGLEEEVVLGD